VQLARRERKALRVRLAKQVLKAQQDIRAIQALLLPSQVQQVQLATQAIRDIRAHSLCLDQQVLLFHLKVKFGTTKTTVVHMFITMTEVLLNGLSLVMQMQDRQGALAQLDTPVLLAHKERLDTRDIRDTQGFQVQLAIRDTQVLQAQQVQLVLAVAVEVQFLNYS
jgi:hypothetical protein